MVSRVSYFVSFMCLMLAFVYVGSAHAEVVRVSASAKVSYSKFDESVKDQALREAKETALKKATASLTTAQKRMMREMEQSFFAELDNFVIEANVQGEKQDKKAKTFALAISASVDLGAINTFFIENSAAGNQQAGMASDFGAFFIARVETDRKRFDDKVTKINQSEGVSTIKEENASDDTSSVDSVSTESMNVTRTGGSSVTKRDEVVYEPRIDVSEDLASAVLELLTDAGFEPMDPLDLDVPFLEDIISEGMMREDGRLPSKLEKQYRDAAIDAGWTFLGMGSIDIGSPQKDPVRGGYKVPATVKFKVWMISDGRAKTVASVKPTLVYAQAPGAGEAQTLAANDAAKMAITTVAAQLQQKQLY